MREETDERNIEGSCKFFGVEKACGVNVGSQHVSKRGKTEPQKPQIEKVGANVEKVAKGTTNRKNFHKENREIKGTKRIVFY